MPQRVLKTIRSNPLLERLRADPRIALAGMAAIAALLALGVVYYLWKGQDNLRPLYGAGERFPAAEVIALLEGEGIPYRLHPQSGQVLVSDEQVARARLLLAAKGVKVSLPAGYELFDKDEPLGTSQFMQDVRLKRSLEGELAQTIMALQGVQQARVHLAREENNSFVIARREPTKASVMLQLAPGYRLEPEQVSAVVNLVAGSVPQLDAKDVRVVDQHGTLLSRDLEGWGGPQRTWQVIEDYQRKAAFNVEEVLTPVLGRDNYRLSVSADIDFSQREETLQTYGQEPRLRNEVTRDESVLDKLALGVPGSLSNTPPANTQAQRQAAQGGQAAQPAPPEDKAATSLRKESNRQLDYDQSVTHVRHAPYRLQQQSVAVVLNAQAAPEGGWTAEARSELEAMVKSAVGFNQARGDVLTLSVLPFTPAAADESANAGLAWWENPNVHEWVKIAVFALISLLLVLLVVRPAVRGLIARPDREAENADAGAEGEGELPAMLASEQAGRLLARVGGERDPAKLFSELNPLSEIRLPAPGSGLEHQIEHLRMLAENDPERVSEVIKQWVGRNDKELGAAG
nr:flagellar basal-body MS-ring/collar protein FliF [uncultured Pseudomonas sp.]